MCNRLVVRGLSGLLVLSTPVLAHGAPTHQRVHPRHVPANAQIVAFRDARQMHPFKEMVAISGRVTLPNGAPAGRARVLLSWMTNSREMRFHAIQTDARGAFAQSVRLSGGSADLLGVTALLPGKGIAWRTVAAPKQLTGLNLRLERGATVTGRLVRLDGRPAANTPIRIKSIAPVITPDRFAHFQFYSIAHILEDKEAMALYKSITDDAGRFTFTGLPHNCNLFFAPAAGLTLTPGSMAPDSIGPADQQDAGILVAAQTGGLKVCVIDSATGKPASNVLVTINNRSGNRPGMFAMGQQAMNGQLWQNGSTNTKGEFEVQGLVPGDYLVTVQGRVIETSIAENRLAEPLRLSLRQGPLKGRLLDADGKPVSNIGIALNPGRTNEEQFGRGTVMTTAWENQMVTMTDAEGRFAIPNFPWGSQEVTVRATRGDDRAEWRGDPKEIGSQLKLQLTPDALITVTGRLIDPQRRLITKVDAQALHWTSLPRTTWFGNAHTIQADAQGRFKLAGLERGESFSFVTGGPFIGGVNRRFFNNTTAIDKNFESPRFVTKTTGKEQNLGDVMVHPLEDGQQSQQIYSDESPADTVRNFNLLPVPTPEMAGEAKNALTRYLSALKAGDLNTVQRLTSRAASGWSDQPDRFLREATLRASCTLSNIEPGTLRAVRFVPRFTAAAVISINRGAASQFGFGSGSSTRELELYPEWVFLTAKQNGHEVVAGILRREDGEWRVVSDLVNTPFNNIDAMVLNSFDNPAAGQKAGQSAPSGHPLSRTDLMAAQQVGERYLQSWAQDRPETMLALTAPASPDHAPKLADYKQRFEGRIDEGLCPLAANDKVQLQPANDLTLREKSWLAGFVQTRGMITPERQRSVRMQQQAGRIASPKLDNIAVYRYQAAGKDMLMLLTHQDNTWEVIEPALPL
jgi:5-hydroxyisourate hydrolase-like protein (transthyretin family)